MADRLPPGDYDPERLKFVNLPNGSEPNGIHYPGTHGDRKSNGMRNGNSGNSLPNLGHVHAIATSNGTNDFIDATLPKDCESGQAFKVLGSKDSGTYHDVENSLKSRHASQTDAEWIEQYEPGVYITLVALLDGTRDLKRVRFR